MFSASVPTARGFGWALFEGPLVPFDWGTVDIARGDKNARAIARFEQLLKSINRPPSPWKRSTSNRQAIRSCPHTGRDMIGRAENRDIDVRAIHARSIGIVMHRRSRDPREIAAKLWQDGIADAAPSMPPKPRKIWVARHPQHRALLGRRLRAHLSRTERA